MQLSVEHVKSLMDRVAKNKLARLEIECEGLKVVIEGPPADVVTFAAPAVAAPAMAAPAAAAPAVTPAAAPAAQEVAAPVSGNVVTSPIVGTFYASSAPDKAPFVAVGKKVKKGDTLFIIESMKLMNEVPSEVDGTVTEILVENAAAVEYGQPILVIE